MKKKAPARNAPLTEPNIKRIAGVLFVFQDIEIHGRGEAVRSVYDLKWSFARV